MVLVEAFCLYSDVLLCFLGIATAADDTVPVLEDFSNFAPVSEELLQRMTPAEHNKDELQIACCRLATANIYRHLARPLLNA